MLPASELPCRNQSPPQECGGTGQPCALSRYTPASPRGLGHYSTVAHTSPCRHPTSHRRSYLPPPREDTSPAPQAGFTSVFLAIHHVLRTYFWQNNDACVRETPRRRHLTPPLSEAAFHIVHTRLTPSLASHAANQQGRPCWLTADSKPHPSEKGRTASVARSVVPHHRGGPAAHPRAAGPSRCHMDRMPPRTVLLLPGGGVSPPGMG